MGLLMMSISLPITLWADNAKVIERGRYLVDITGCNDCHTPGYPESNGNIPEPDRLTGSDVGFSGPWGVSYASNLRKRVAEMSLEQWHARLNGGGLPPMPWPAVSKMTKPDQEAVYHYLRSLGPKGKSAPLPLAPGVPINTLHIVFVPQAGDAMTPDGAKK